MSKGDTLSASYFRTLLEEETIKLSALCDKWQAVLNDQTTESSVTNGQDKQEGLLNDDDSGHIRSAIGLAHLLMNQRFKQFSSLIKDCEAETTPKVTPDDLQGFWEMVEFQVKDVHSRFEKLQSISSNS